MPEIESLPVSPRRPSTRWWKRTLTVLFILALVWGGRHLWLSSKVSTVLKQLHADGHPIAPDQLDRFYPNVQGPNAADVYLKAFAALVSDSGLESDLPFFGNVEMPSRDQPLSDDIYHAISQYLAKNETALQHLHQAASIDQCRYPGEITQDNDDRINRLNAARRASTVLVLQVLGKYHVGRIEEALRSLEATVHLAESLQKEPFVGSFLIKASIESQLLGMLNWILSAGGFSDSQLREMGRVLASPDSRRVLIRAFEVERCLSISMFDAAFAQSARRSLRTAVSVNARRGLGLIKMDKLAYLAMMSRLIGTKDLPRSIYGQTMRSLSDVPSYYQATKHAAKRYKFAITMALAMDAYCDCALAAIATVQSAMSDGKLPDGLSDLVPVYLERVPQDAFDGNPLRYRKQEDGFTVYSVGTDGVDGGGKPVESGSSEIIFTVRWPPAESDSISRISP